VFGDNSGEAFGDFEGGLLSHVGGKAMGNVEGDTLGYREGLALGGVKGSLAYVDGMQRGT
jgi:hypothetical protein